MPHGHDPVMSENLDSYETSFTLGPLRLDASVAQTFENRSIESITMVGRHTFGDTWAYDKGPSRVLQSMAVQ